MKIEIKDVKREEDRPSYDKESRFVVEARFNSVAELQLLIDSLILLRKSAFDADQDPHNV